WVTSGHRAVFYPGLIGDAGGFGRIFRGRRDVFVVVRLAFFREGNDGEESSVWTNFTSINSRRVASASPSLTGDSLKRTPDRTLIRYSSTNTCSLVRWSKYCIFF